MTTMRVLLLGWMALAAAGCGNQWAEQQAKRNKPPANVAAPPGTESETTQPADAGPPVVTFSAEDASKTPPSLEQLPKVSEPAVPAPLTGMVDPAPPAAVPAPDAPPDLTVDAKALLAAADPHPERRLEEATQLVAGAQPELAVSSQPSGAPALELRYPWNEFARPSLVVVWFADGTEPPAQPALVMDGLATQRKWVQMIDRLNDPEYRDSGRSVKTLKDFWEFQDGRAFTLRARVNPAGRELAYGLERDAGTTLVFYALNAWREGDGALRFSLDDLDLAQQFAVPGKIRVWFLSNEQPVWGTVLPWPGQPNRALTQPAPETPAKNALSMPEVAVPGAASAALPPAAPPLALPAAPPLVSPERPKPGPGPSPSLANKPETTPPAKRVSPLPVPNPAEIPPKLAGQTPTLPTTPTATTPPVTTATTAAPANPRDMSIRELSVYIEKQYKKSMSKDVRKSWVAGYQEYFFGKNPSSVKRTNFMSFLRDAYSAEPPKELAKLFKVLFDKLDAEQKANETR